jgi:biopolymer transport protein ExbD
MRPIRDKSLQPICRINVAGLASVMFVLAMTWCVATTPLLCKCVGIDLPNVSHDRLMRDAVREDALVIAVQKDGTVFYRSSKVTPDQLTGAIHAGLLEGARDTVYLRADVRARYAPVKEALEGIRAAGITKIAILTDSRGRPEPYCCQAGY